MKKYIVFGFTNVETFNKSEEPTQQERELIFKQWMEWKDELGELLVSMGSPLINGVALNDTGILDDNVSNLSGYMIIKAENQKHAYELLNKSPLFQRGHGQKYELFECIM